MVETIDAVRSVFPDKPLPGGRLTIRDPADAEAWVQVTDAAVSRVARLFPVMEDFMTELLAEGEPLRIYPDHAGFSWTWDDMDELLRDPASWADNVDLAAFFKVLWIMVD